MTMLNGGGKSGYNFSVSAVPETTRLKSASIFGNEDAAAFLRLPPGGGIAFAAGVGPARLAAPRQAGFWELRQTHSALWHEVKNGEPRAGTEGDALLASTTETILAIKTADCLPLLLHAPDLGMIAAVHAGWRGLAKDLPALVVKELLARGAALGNLRIVLGPAICGPCYEIGPEVAAQFAAFPPGDYLTTGRADRLHFSQHEFARTRLLALGIDAENIWRSDLCTRHDALPSFRRDGQDCGRLYSCIWQ